MATYKRQRYLLMSTDPVHIGTGGYRLGRVDNSIVREPGTRVPKVPGTSLSGAARSYAASQYGNLDCAGQKKHCGDNEHCPICYTFGSLNEEGGETAAFSGVANLFDAHVLLFPVHTMAGPAWVTTPHRLVEAGFTIQGLPADADWPVEQACFTWERSDALNLGWLMLEPGSVVTVAAPETWQGDERWAAVRDHLVLVQEALFGQVVNSNLEVRTSVSIDPERGAAEEGALFTYEALPRATFLVSDVVLDDYRADQPDRPFSEDETQDGGNLTGVPWAGPLEVVRAGLRMIEWLGVGGMGTRGFGRLAIVGQPLEQTWGEEVPA